MEKFLVEHFFDLTHFSHANVFHAAQYAWEPLVHLEEYLKTLKLGRIECHVAEGVFLVDPESISIGKGTVIEPGAFIRGPCVIGRDCQIRHGAYVRGNVLAGDLCVIGHASEVKSSIFLNGVSAAHFNYVGDSILGNKVNLGAGVKLANLRLDSQLVELSVSGKKISTNLKKLGAIIGDGAQLGCNAVANPGTLIGKGVICRPCLTLSGYIPPMAKVKSTQKVVVQEYVDRSCL